MLSYKFAAFQTLHNTHIFPTVSCLLLGLVLVLALVWFYGYVHLDWFIRYTSLALTKNHCLLRLNDSVLFFGPPFFFVDTKEKGIFFVNNSIWTWPNFSEVTGTMAVIIKCAWLITFALATVVVAQATELNFLSLGDWGGQVGLFAYFIISKSFWWRNFSQIECRIRHLTQNQEKLHVQLVWLKLQKTSTRNLFSHWYVLFIHLFILFG